MPHEFAITPNHFRSFLRDVPSEELFTMERQVRELQESPGWAVVEKLLASERVRIIGSLEQGLMPYEQIARRTGGLAGMKAAHYAADAVLGAAEAARAELAKMPVESAGERER